MSQFKNITGASGGHAFQPGTAAAHYSEGEEAIDAEEEPANTHSLSPPSHPPLSSTVTATISTPSLTANDEMNVDNIKEWIEVEVFSTQ